MRKIKAKSPKKQGQSKKLLLYVLLPLLALGVLTFAAVNQWFTYSKAQELRNIIILFPNPDIARPNLQLYTFPFITVAPKPTTPPYSAVPSPTISKTPNSPIIGNYCPLDDLVPEGSTCRCLDMNAIACPVAQPTLGAPTCPQGEFPFRLPPGTGPWFCIKMGSPGLTSPLPPAPPPGCFNSCIAKPVVYLYPTEKTLVDVSVTSIGEVFISDPLYPEGGWKNVEAHPDGTLFYQGKKYTELFYETTVAEKIEMPETGILIERKNIASELRRITTQLGLINHEQEEFLEFWVPLMQKQNAPYIYFSLLPPDVKAKHDTLNISPEPDTRIEFIAYFKPLQKKIPVAPLDLPETPPARVGFTEVEWGGTIGE